ncbi:hypothetical protein ABZ759_00050 [Streptomyces sp. NPDC047860]|uniref:hypothetical protein n=1 Tax=Streptomyces sp. NPDC047860 TaxID=3155743 RepID=UPI0033FE277F
MTRAAWRRLRERMSVSGSRSQDRTDSADEETAGEPGRTEEPAHTRPDSICPGSPESPESKESPESDHLIVGCLAVLAALFLTSGAFLVIAFFNGVWDFSRRAAVWVVVSVVFATIVAALAWLAGMSWRRRSRRNGPTEASPPAERTKDDQNSVGKP